MNSAEYSSQTLKDGNQVKYKAKTVREKPIFKTKKEIIVMMMTVMNWIPEEYLPVMYLEPVFPLGISAFFFIK